MSFFLKLVHTLLWCLFVCLFESKKKVKTAQPIGCKFCVATYMTSGKAYGRSNLKNVALLENVQRLLFLKRV